MWPLLKDLFRLDRSLELALETKYASLLTVRAKFICMHIRRGDYLNHPKLHGILHAEYYSTAIARMQSILKGQGKLLVFSDDVKWCRQ